MQRLERTWNAIGRGGSENFCVAQQKNLSLYKKKCLINANIMTLQSLRKPYFSKVQFCRHPVIYISLTSNIYIFNI